MTADVEANEGKKGTVPFGKRGLSPFSRWAIPLFAVGFVLVFSPCWSAGTFIAHDQSILRLPILSNWRNLPTIMGQDFMIFSDGLYRPVSYALVAILRTIVPADAVWFWHTMLLAVHALNTLMVFLIARRFVEHTAGALLAAGVFCFHPLATVSTNHINNLHILLGVTWYLYSLLCYISFRDRRRYRCLVLSVVAFALGALTSPVALMLPLLLMVWDLLYEKRGLCATLISLSPFFVVAAGAIFLQAWLRPHPLLFSYSAAEHGEWPSFFSMIAGTPWYGSGLVSGYGVPAILHERVARIFTFRNRLFCCWSAVHVFLLFIAVVRTARRDLLGLGMLLIYFSMIPFSTTALNPVEAYVSWIYLYAPTIGLAFMAASIEDKVLSCTTRPARVVGSLLLLILAGQYAWRLHKLNAVTRDPISYWAYVISYEPETETGQFELSNAYLARNDVENALSHFFAPGIRKLYLPSGPLCRYYLQRGDLSAASVHAAFTKDMRPLADLLYARDMPDHAESVLGVALATNPFDTRAMKDLARILAEKGYLPAADRWAKRAAEIDPSDAEARDLVQTLRRSDAAAPSPRRLTPPRADWLRFILDRRSTAHIRKELVDLSEQHPNDPMIQIAAAQALIENGEAVPALLKLEKVSTCLAFSSFFAELFCHALTISGNPREAASVAVFAVQRNPDSARLHYYLGDALLVDGRTVEAVKIFMEAVRLSPDFAPAYYKLGFAHAQLGYLDDAVACYSKAVQLQPNFADAHTNLGEVLLKQGRAAEAIVHYERALALRPLDPTAHVDLGSALAEAGKPDQAAACYAEALELDPNAADAHTALARLYVRKGDIAKAMEQYSEVLRINPNDGLAHFNLSRALALQGRNDEATAHLREALRISPGDGLAHFALANLLSQGGKFSEAIEHFTEAVALLPNAAEPAGRFAWLLATCPDARLRDGERAVSLGEKSCQLTPHRDPEMLDALAAAYAEAGRFDEAAQTAGEALRLLKERTNTKREDLERQIEQRLALYKARRPYRAGVP